MSRPRILVVEDERIIAFTLSQMLTTQGYEVVGVVYTGEEAIVKAGSARPDLVLMDVNLGAGIDGIEAAAMIRERFQVPSLFLTAFVDDEVLRRVPAVTSAAVLTKPFQALDLKNAIEFALTATGAD